MKGRKTNVEDYEVQARSALWEEGILYHIAVLCTKSILAIYFTYKYFIVRINLI